MKEFLYQVAEHCLQQGALQEKLLVFPNRRSIVFFTKHLRTLISKGDAPVILPEMLTVADFFGKLYGSAASDKVSLLLVLYDVYKTVYPKAEALDDFIFWGDVLLSDFSDTDKYLVDPKQLFTNVADLKSIEDSYSYLSQGQRDAIKQFLSHFKNGGGETAPIKARFLGIWNILLPLYQGFRKVLEEKGMAYDGMIYRSVAERFKTMPAADIVGGKHVVFIGLNALNECELLVMRSLRDARMASFCWDYCGPMIKDRSNRSSFFMDGNVRTFPMDWQLEDPEGLPQVNVVAVPSATGQAKFLPDLIKNADDTAVVIPDETMLMPVLGSVPDSVERVNVTMGVPLSGSRIHALMHQVALLQLHLRKSGEQWYFYHKYVWNILSGGILRQLLSEDEWNEVLKVKKAAKYYIPESDFSACGPILRMIMRPIVTDTKTPSAENIRVFQAYLEEVLDAMSGVLENNGDLAAELEFAGRWKGCIRALKGKNLDILPVTYIRLLGQIAAMQTVPLEGEPLGGLQVMGPLETRALDFGTVILLSCNEGVFPRRSVSASFIPPQLRTAFGLPTYEFQDSIWAYYFYRMICRAQTVWLLYDTRSEGGRSGEESRYIKQLRYHFRLPVRSFVAKAGVGFSEPPASIPKPADIVLILKAKPLSASSLKNYLACPVKFFYSKILDLKPEEEVAESLDNGMLGDIFHKTMQNLYENAPGAVLTEAYLTACIKGKESIRESICEQIKQKVKVLDVNGKNLILQDVIMQYVVKTLQTDLSLVRQRGDIRILGLEKLKKWNLDGYDFVGYIDRMDAFKDGTVRVVDYKTGKVLDKDIYITDSNAPEVAGLLFGTDNGKRPDISLQLFLYDMFIEDSLPPETRLVNCIYHAPSLFSLGIFEADVSHVFCRDVKDRLSSLLAEIANPEIPFSRTDDVDYTCKYCDFKNICGR